MQNLFNDLEELLQKDEAYFSQDGSLLRNLVIEKGLKLDPDLLNHLLSHDRIRQHFFTQVGEVLVFDKEKFLQFVNNKQFLPDSYTAFKNKIGLSDDGGKTLISQKRDVELVWPYKDCVLEGGQTKEDAKRDEIFWNTTLAPDDISRLLEPKVFTNYNRFTSDNNSLINSFTIDNLLLRGNNLLILSSLREKFAGKVKLIYIDPPYNTDSVDFNYNDSFGHSTWLTFMQNRLTIARELLSSDGAIFTQISDNGVCKLRLLLDDIFGRENFINLITVKTRSPSGFKTVNLGVFESAEYILVYGKNKEKWKYHQKFVESDYDSNYNKIVVNKSVPKDKWLIRNLRDLVAEEMGYEDQYEARTHLGMKAFNQSVSVYALNNADRAFRFTTINPDAGKETLAIKAKSLKSPEKIFFVERENYADRIILNGQEITFYQNKLQNINGELVPTTYLTNIWTDIPWEGIANEGNVKLKQGKKPEKLLHRIIDMSTQEGDLVLDFFLGSGTTAAVAHKMGRRYIGIEQLDYGKNSGVVRLQNVINGDKTGISKFVDWKGGGSFVSCELLQWNESFIRQIEAAESTNALWLIWEEIQKRGQLSYQVSPKSINENAQDFKELSLANQKRFLLEVLDKNALYVNYSEIDDVEYGVSEEDKRLNHQFYGGEA